jgi:hypothetical protein
MFDQTDDMIPFEVMRQRVTEYGFKRFLARAIQRNVVMMWPNCQTFGI